MLHRTKKINKFKLRRLNEFLNFNQKSGETIGVGFILALEGNKIPLADHGGQGYDNGSYMKWSLYLPLDPRFVGSIPADDGSLMAIKVRSLTFFRRDAKLSV
jgi:hypothetical protein